MSPEESLAIIRLAKGAFPATNMDEFTPDAWALALEDEQFMDAREALKALMREQTFIHVSDIIQRIKRIRGERVLEFGPLPDPPSELTDAEYAGWLYDITRRIANGEEVVRPALAAPGERPDIDFAKMLPDIEEATT